MSGLGVAAGLEFEGENETCIVHILALAADGKGFGFIYLPGSFKGS